MLHRPRPLAAGGGLGHADILLPMGDLLNRLADHGDRRVATANDRECGPRERERMSAEPRSPHAGAAVR